MIQGVFFFAYPGEPMQYYHFAGMIHPEQDSVEGQLTDKFGDSVLTDVEVSVGTPETIAFTKTYTNRKDHIRYKFTRKSDDIWLGVYDGPATGKGKVNAVITNVAFNFLTPKWGR